MLISRLPAKFTPPKHSRMILLYDLGIRLYYLIIAVVSPFNKKAKLWITGRQKWHSKLVAAVEKDAPIAWFHCASLGEFEQGRPLIEALKQQKPEYKILLTFFSPSGYEVRKNYQGADYVFYLPLDTRRNARRLIKAINPKVVVFVKYEFWYHILKAIHRANIPIYIVSAIFRSDQLFFKWYGGLYRRILTFFEHIFVQSSDSEALLNGIGVTNVTVAGDTRFDRVADNAKAAKVIPMIEAFAKDSKVLVGGSTWPKDEELIAGYFTSQRPSLKLIIAPHEIHNDQVESLIAKIGLPAVRFTQYTNQDLSKAQVLVIDTIGILSSVYRYGDIAYIGGGFGAGIHNTLEAAVFGIPVIFGPNHHKFREAVGLKSCGGGISISSQEELNLSLNALLTSAQELENAGKAAYSYIYSSLGATSIILKRIVLKLP